jgi:hypothetical protein
MAARDSEFAQPRMRLWPTRVLAGAVLALLLVGAGWLGAQSFGWRVVAHEASLPAAGMEPALAAEFPETTRNLRDDVGTITDINSIDAPDVAATIPAAHPQSSSSRAHESLDLGLPAPDTSPALRPETLAKLLMPATDT